MCSTTTISSGIHNVQKPLVLSACLFLDEAKAIYEAILENGPLDTVRLRREARMSAESAKSRFDRALVELQVGLKLLPIGVARTGAWNYAFTYELFQRWFPEVPEQARGIKRSGARQVLVHRGSHAKPPCELDKSQLLRDNVCIKFRIFV
jgi:hypothetical protein